MKKVLLTGATGFIGRHCLSSLLTRGFEVHAVSSGEELKDAPPEVRWHKADLLNSSQVEELTGQIKATHLLHAAWYAVPGKYWTSLENIRWVKASLELMQAFAHNNGRRAVMVGSCAEYDWRYGYCSEDVTPLAPQTLYGVCKHSLRMMLESFSRERGLSAAWGRIFFLYGPHEPEERLVASVTRSLLKGERARCSHGKQVRDFLYVKDVADALAALLDSSVEGAVNVASGQPVALSTIIQTIAEKIGLADSVEFGVIESPMSEPPLIVGNVGRLRDEVCWRQRYDLQMGVDETIRWWRHRLNETGAQLRLGGREE